jgi:formylglycine-generating enzyme required for sulfatase activity
MNTSFKNVLALLAFTSLAGPAASAAAPLCANVFASEEFLDLDKAILDLAKLKITLDEAKAQGPMTPQVRSLIPIYEKAKGRILDQGEDSARLTDESLEDVLRETIQKLQQTQKEKMAEEKSERENTEKTLTRQLTTENYQQQMIFQPIPPGHFTDYFSKQTVQVDRAFYLMATQVTQKMWTDLAVLMGKSSKYPNKSSMQGNAYPVDNVSYWTVREFILDLNRLARRSEKDGALKAALLKIIPEHRDGDRYGLPTIKQRTYAATNLGVHSLNRFFDRADDKEMALYNWDSTNSQGTTKPVALLLPRIINGLPFYDLNGNVFEMVFEPGAKYVDVLGGSYNFSTQVAASNFSKFRYEKDSVRDGVGFRLMKLSR